MMLNLSKITLCAISSVKIQETIKAIDFCKNQCLFNRIIFFSDQNVPYGHKIPRINNISDYNKFVLYDLPNYLKDSEFVLTIHWDGFIINPDSWTDDFYRYDYIGAPWPWFNNICGNGGFCLKSNKFLASQINIISHHYNYQDNQPEDLVLCYLLRKHFIEYGCNYAPPRIAYKFSTESFNAEYFVQKPFGFHDFKYHPNLTKLI